MFVVDNPNATQVELEDGEVSNPYHLINCEPAGLETIPELHAESQTLNLGESSLSIRWAAVEDNVWAAARYPQDVVDYPANLKPEFLTREFQVICETDELWLPDETAAGTLKFVEIPLHYFPQSVVQALLGNLCFLLVGIDGEFFQLGMANAGNYPDVTSLERNEPPSPAGLYPLKLNSSLRPSDSALKKLLPAGNHWCGYMV